MMLVDLLTLISLTLSLLAGYFRIFDIPLWVIVLPISIAYLLRILAFMYARFSQSRWEEFQRIRSLEKEGYGEFRDVMIGTIVALLRKKEEPAPSKKEEVVIPGAEYVPPGAQEGTNE
jgi:hypothetical protein